MEIDINREEERRRGCSQVNAASSQ